MAILLVGLVTAVGSLVVLVLQWVRMRRDDSDDDRSGEDGRED
jgi:hypothetical protein